MTSGYAKNASNVYDSHQRQIFPLGFFVEDYSFNSENGTLDKNNGAFVKDKRFSKWNICILCMYRFLLQENHNSHTLLEILLDQIRLMKIKV